MTDGRPLSAPEEMAELLVNTKTGESLGVLESTRECLRFSFTLEPGESIPATHWHPESEQRVKVHEGELHLRVAGRHVIVRAGESIAVRAGAAHFQWNPGKTPVLAEESYHPPGRLHDMFATFFRLSSEGMLRRGGGVASPLLVAAFFAEFRDSVRAWPFVAQWALDALAPLARRLGYQQRVRAACEALANERTGRGRHSLPSARATSNPFPSATRDR